MVPPLGRPAVEQYLSELVSRLRDALPLAGAWAIGSIANGAFAEGRSDLDVLAVCASPPSGAQLAAVVATCSHDALPCPARKLELVVYDPAFEVALNLNTGPGETTTADAEGFWFVVDRAVAHAHALTLHGPPASEVLPEPDAAELDRALTEMVAWYEANEPGEPARLAAARVDAHRRTGRWVSKADVA